MQEKPNIKHPEPWKYVSWTLAANLLIFILYTAINWGVCQARGLHSFAFGLMQVDLFVAHSLICLGLFLPILLFWNKHVALGLLLSVFVIPLVGYSVCRFDGGTLHRVRH